MFETVWPALTKSIEDGNKLFDEALSLKKLADSKIRESEYKLTSVVESLDAVLKQCTGKTGSFTPLVSAGKITGISIKFESGGISVTRVLEIDEAPRIQEDKKSLSE